MQQELVERARRGDHDAFAALAGASIFRLDAAARLILRDPDQAKDAVQETLVRAWRDLPTLRSPDRFEAWLHRLLYRACIDEARRLRRHRVDVELTPIDSPSVDDGVSVTNDRDQLERGFSRLEPEARALIVLHHYLDLPLPEVAIALGIPLGNGEIAPAPSTRIHASGSRRRCPTSVGDHGGPSGMTLNDGFERTLSDWLNEQAGHGMPGYLDEALARTTRTRQRPAWSSLRKVAPRGYDNTNLRFAARPTLGRVLLLGAVLAALIGLALIAVGSRNPRVPAPFGIWPPTARSRTGLTATSWWPTPTGRMPTPSSPAQLMTSRRDTPGMARSWFSSGRCRRHRRNADDRRSGRIRGSVGLDGAPDPTHPGSTRRRIVDRWRSCLRSKASTPCPSSISSTERCARWT